MVKRRQYLTGTGALLTTGFAGCFGSSETVPITITEHSPLFNSVTVEAYKSVNTQWAVLVELSEKSLEEGVDKLHMFVDGDVDDTEYLHVGQSKSDLDPYTSLGGEKCEIVAVSNEEYVDRIVFRVE